MGDENNTQDRRATEVRLTDETIQYLRQEIAVAVGQGLKSAMTEDTATAYSGAATVATLVLHCFHPAY